MAYASLGTLGTPVNASTISISLVVGNSAGAVGTLAVVCFMNNHGAPANSFSDSKGNTWKKVAGYADVRSNVEVWASLVTVALVSADTITAVFGSAVAASIMGMAFSGGNGTLIEDTATIGNSASATDVTVPAIIQTAANGSLVIGLRCTTVAATEDAAASTNYTAGVSQTAAAPAVYMEYSIVATPASRTLSGQWSAATGFPIGLNVAILLNSLIAPRNVKLSCTEQPRTGRQLTFSVYSAEATSYQWLIDTGGGFGNITSATSSTYTTAALVTGDTGKKYACDVTNANGTTRTGSYTLTVADTPVESIWRRGHG